MEQNKIATLINLLVVRSQAGKLLWEKTIDEGVFQTTLGGYTVRLSPRHRRGVFGDERYVLIEINNAEGELIEEVSDTDVNSNDLWSLYEIARRQAMGVDAALDTIISELER